MAKYNEKTNLLEEHDYEYSLKNVEEPNLYRDIFPFNEVPKITFNDHRARMDMPREIWMTDTTFRDGQQSREPYTVKQMTDLYIMLHRLGGKKGLVRQTEFFVYSEKDRVALEKCMELGYEFPEVTTWIRASMNDFRLVKGLGVKETGILVSCSDYHIFKKLKMDRAKAMEHYLGVVSEVMSVGLKPRCHLEDLTRADFFGFVVPFVNELVKLSKQSGIPVKIRACDTMGYGVPYPEASLPRSVPGIMHGLREYCGVPSEGLEWHGHNDFNKGVVNGCAAWMYGASAVNCSLLGIGERTGYVPLESMAIEYASLRGNDGGMDLAVMSEIAEYYDKEIGYHVPPMTPFVGKDFNVTRAGIHADGLLKDEEIYNIFDTEKILGKPAAIAVSNVSGLAGIAYWLNQNYRLTGEEKVSKTDAAVARLKEWVDSQYENGRVTSLSDQELAEQAGRLDGRFGK